MQVLKDVLCEARALDKSFTYKLEYCLYLHTNDENIGPLKNIVNLGLGDAFDTNPDDEMFKYLLAYLILNRNYKYKGYHVFLALLLAAKPAC